MSTPWGHQLVLGTWLNFEHDQGAVDALVEAALELGISAFDTADLYGDGAAEPGVEHGGGSVRGRPAGRRAVAGIEPKTIGPPPRGSTPGT